MSGTLNTDVWRVETAGGTTPISWLEETQPAAKRGETADFDFRLVPDGRGDHVGRYKELTAYIDWGGEYHLHDVGGGLFAYTEAHEGNAPDGSLLVAVRPPNDSRTGRGLWGLVDSVGDDTEVPHKRCLVTLSIAYIAPYGDGPHAYRDRQTLVSDLEAPTLL